MQVQLTELTAPVAMTDALLTYVTSPDNKKTQMSFITFTNKGTAALGIDAHIVPDGGTASASNKVLSNKVIDADEAWPAYPLAGHIMPAGATLPAKINTATSTDVVIFVSGAYLF